MLTPSMSSSDLTDTKIVAVLWFLALALLLVTAGLSLTGIGHWLAQPPHVDWADAIIVLSGGRQRILRGISLYEQGLAPEIWHTGSAQCPSVQFAVQLAIEHGVPAEAIHLLPTHNTWEDGQKIAALAKERQVQSVLVVTDWTHSRRALCVVEQHLADSGIAIYYAPPTDSPYWPGNWWQYKNGWAVVGGELVKIGFYWVRYGLAPWRC